MEFQVSIGPIVLKLEKNNLMESFDKIYDVLFCQ